MEALFSSGHAVDIVLVVLVMEGIVLIVRGRNAADIFWMLLPAALILLALRAALTDMDWPWIAGFLAASFPAHLIDLQRRAR